MTEPPVSGRDPGKAVGPLARAVGALLVLAGALWTVFAGGCTLIAIVQSVSGMAGSHGESISQFAPLLGLILIVGSVGIVPGALILWGGISILRGPR